MEPNKPKKEYSEEEKTLVSKIDMAEAFFWKFHEHASDETLKNNEKEREEAAKILKEKYHYTDADIRQAWEDLCKDKWKK
jgi:uncharacterized protein YwgA